MNDVSARLLAAAEHGEQAYATERGWPGRTGSLNRGTAAQQVNGRTLSECYQPLPGELPPPYIAMATAFGITREETA